MNKHVSCKMGDVVALEQGLAINKKSKHLLVDKGYPLLRITDMINQKFAQFIDTEAIPKKFIAKDDDLIFSRTGQVGLIFRNQTGVIHNNCFRITPSKKLDRGFLYWFLKQGNIKAYINTLAGGAAQPDLNHDAFKSVLISFPDCVDEQKKIASIFDEYDNLIENNNRRIAILEEMAQSLYREWFVNFRYPDHAEDTKNSESADENSNAATDENNNKATLIDSLLGLIPEGWEVKTAAEAIDINPKTKLVKDGEKLFVGMSGLAENSMVIGDIIEKTGNSGAKFINGDTLFARITPCLQNGKTGYVQFLPTDKPVGFGSTEFIVLRESEFLSSEFIYLLSRSNNFREHAMQSMTGATGRQRVHNDCFASFYIATPPKKLMDEFTYIVQPMFKSIFNLSRRNENLKKQRDMLLPKLISGDIDL